MRIILASYSPRRKELLSSICENFEIIPSKKEEDMSQKMSIKNLSKSLAKQKAQDIFDQTTGDRVVIGSDSMVCLKNKIYGKPKNKDEAKSMLCSLSGKWHFVISGICVIIERNGKQTTYCDYEISKVKFAKLTQNDIDSYLLKDEYKDKAGAYAIQGLAGKFVEKIKGNYANIVGLGTAKLYNIFKQENLL